MNSRTRLLRAAALTLFAMVPACVSPQGATPDEERAHIQEVERETLARLYEAYPDAKAVLENAPGYAVFDTAVTKVPFLGAGGGFGVVVDRDPEARTYMSVREYQAGVGFGIRNFQIVMIFHTEEVREDIKDGEWDFGANAEASAKSGDSGTAGGGATGSGDGVTRYVLTEKGISLTATVGALRFSRLDRLNP